MSLLVRPLLGGLCGAAAATLLVTTGFSVAVHADDVDATGDELTGNTATVRLGAICPGESRSGTVGFELERRGSGANVWANSTIVTITTPGATTGSGNVTGTTASATTPADWVTVETGNDDNGKTTEGSSSTVTVAVPAGATPGTEESVVLTYTGRGAGYTGGQVSRADNVLVRWTVASDCTPPDSTPPEITYSLSSTPSAAGWYAGPVAIDWTVTDPESAVELTGCEDAEQSDETDGRTFTCSATSAGGVAGPVTVTVRVDATAPTVVPEVSGPTGTNGWFTGDALLHWQVADARSGLADEAACPDVPVTADQAETEYACTVEDLAGNSTTVSTTVKRDASAPVVSRTVTGTVGSNGWYTSPVEVDWSVTEGTSTPVSLVGCEDTTVQDTAGTTLICEATNDAGLSTTGEPVELKVDTVAPAVGHTLVGTLGDEGWYTSDVDVDFSVTDATSGVATSTGCDPEPLTTDTLGTTYTCSATDAAGNTASDDVTVKRDARAPEVTWTGGPADGAVYDFGDPVPAASCTADDETSGVDGAGCTVAGADSAVGTHTLTASARDRAGNRTSVTRSYTVRPWFVDGFLRPVTMGEGVVNTVKAGSTVPLKFDVHRGGPTGPDVTGEVGSIVMTRVPCDGSDSAEPVTAVASTGSTALRYSDGQWIQNWATPASGKGSCYRVTLTTLDGSTISAGVLLK